MNEDTKAYILLAIMILLGGALCMILQQVLTDKKGSK